MSSHIYHPPSHTHGLCDECPKCVSRIDQPLQLDDQNLARLWRGEHHTRTDVRVYDALYRAVGIVDRLRGALELPVPHYSDPTSLWAHRGAA